MKMRNIRVQSAAIVVLAILLGLMESGSMLYCATDSHQSGAVNEAAKAEERKPKLDVPYEPTAYEIAEEMLRLAGVHKNDIVYDLGCGDGRINIMAAKERGARGVGVDLDPERIRESKENARQAGVSDKVAFFQQDLFKTDITKATVVMLYLWPEVNLRLRPKLFTDLRPGTRVVSHSHTMGDWKPDKTSEVSKHQLYFWVIPANATGTWTWDMPQGKGSAPAHAVLRIDQQFQEVKGELTIGGNTAPITNATLAGDRVRMLAEYEKEGQKTSAEFSGLVRGNVIRGTIKMSGGAARRTVPWKATRDPATRIALDK
jgi:SAM-dependent methyltransferase